MGTDWKNRNADVSAGGNTEQTLTSPSFMKKFTRKAIGMIAVMSLIVTIPLVSGMLLPSASLPTAEAKTVAEYDKDIEEAARICEQRNQELEQAQADLSDTANWYYKSVSGQGGVSNLILGESMHETVDRISYMDRIYSSYVEKRDTAIQAKEAAEEAQAELIRLRREHKEKEELEKQRKAEEERKRIEHKQEKLLIQFPQGHDQPWSSIKYWNGTIATSGCGVCSYTSIIDYLCDKDYTPADMMEIRGDWRGMDGYPKDGTGVKGGGSHASFTKETFGLDMHNIEISLDSLKKSLKDGKSAAIVCSRGRSFKNNSGDWRWSNGHFVAVFAYDDEGFHVSDSAYITSEGSNVIYNDSEMATMLSNSNHITLYRK